MKRLTLLLVVVSILALLVGSVSCSNGDGDNNEGSNNDGGGGGNVTVEEQWAAYAFDQMVSPASGTSGKISSFTMIETYEYDGKTRKFKIEGEYLGESTVDIKMNKTDLATFQNTTVTTPVECYKIKHHITVLQALSGDDNPEWVDLTIFIPTTGIETTAMYLWIYPMAIYEDSDGHTGEWSYYVTEAMQSEMDQGTAGYSLYTDGTFYSYDSWVLLGLYGYMWPLFSEYTTEGNDYLEEGSWSVAGTTYSCTSGTETIGSYSFDAWTLIISSSYEGDSGGYKGIFSPDLPLPIYMKVGASTGGSQTYLFEYDLTGITLE